MTTSKRNKKSSKRKVASRVEEKKPVNRGRHEASCTVCAHPQREEIEREWADWGNTTRIGLAYDLSRDSLYRHAHALGLFARRQRNIRKALEHLIEKADAVDVNASAVVSAIQAYAKINNSGQWVERMEGINMNELFDRMTPQELEAYARDGTLPGWFSSLVGATHSDGQEETIED